MATASLEILDEIDLSECTICLDEFDGMQTDGDLCPACQAHYEATEAAGEELAGAEEDLDTLESEMAELRGRLAEARRRVRAARKALAKLEG